MYVYNHTYIYIYIMSMSNVSIGKQPKFARRRATHLYPQHPFRSLRTRCVAHGLAALMCLFRFPWP